MKTKYLMEGHKWNGKWILAPKSDMTTPKFGRLCYGPSFWLVTENDELLFYEAYYSPQCNIDATTLAKVIDVPFKTHVEFIEMAFLPHNCSDYF